VKLESRQGLVCFGVDLLFKIKMRENNCVAVHSAVLDPGFCALAGRRDTLTRTRHRTDDQSVVDS
jgi:hypothetical protein